MHNKLYCLPGVQIKTMDFCYRYAANVHRNSIELCTLCRLAHIEAGHAPLRADARLNDHQNKQIERVSITIIYTPGDVTNLA